MTPRFAIVPHAIGFTVLDTLHNVERGLYTTKQGAQRRIDELSGRIRAKRGSMVSGEDKERNYPCDVAAEEAGR